ncbi:MAG: hypothetical protein IKA17_01435 [Clostridia bacterium]|nr:hypothetical protein [Clostridia bacterium]
MMLRTEKKYEFRKRLLNIHREDIRDYTAVPTKQDAEIKNGFAVVVPKNCPKVILTAARDLVDYLFTSMKVFATVSEEKPLDNYVVCTISENQTEDYIITFDEGIKISGKTDRAVAQAIYALEDKMNVRKAPFIEKESIRHTFMFSPRMVHSGYGLDMYPDEHLASIAHAGMDAIVVFVKDVNLTPSGFMDFNELIYRASRYGIDVYAYSYLKSRKHPDDKDAQEFYDNLYGRIFEECPGFKGIVLVGESVEFPSKDEHVSPKFHSENFDEGIPESKPSPGWWPCSDYPKWLECVKKAVRKHRKDADIVFWTYNWGYAPEEDRLRLIRSLPTDISLQVTYEMFENVPMGSITKTCADYTLSFEGPGQYFVSEAKEAKKRGIRLYTMSNTGGLTWDFGVIPYEPMPYQWIKRYEGLRKAYKDWGLCGLMDSHHFGFYPSFIGDLAKQCFILENDDSEKCVMDVLTSRFGKENATTVDDALRKWSEAITYYTPSDADQYGAFRIGPAFPFCLIKESKAAAEKHAHFGNGIYEVTYPADYSPTNKLPMGRGILPAIRLDEEIKSLDKMLSLIEEGTEILRQIPESARNENLSLLLNMGEFLCCYVRTGINAKHWYYLRSHIHFEKDPEKVLQLAAEIEKLGKLEIENAQNAIEFVRKDSRLGWEPSMEYMADEKRILWKIKHLNYVLDFELGCFVKNCK